MANEKSDKKLDPQPELAPTPVPEAKPEPAKEAAPDAAAETSPTPKPNPMPKLDENDETDEKKKDKDEDWLETFQKLHDTVQKTYSDMNMDPVGGLMDKASNAAQDLYQKAKSFKFGDKDSDDAEKTNDADKAKTPEGDSAPNTEMSSAPMSSPSPSPTNSSITESVNPAGASGHDQMAMSANSKSGAGGQQQGLDLANDQMVQEGAKAVVGIPPGTPTPGMG